MYKFKSEDSFTKVKISIMLNIFTKKFLKTIFLNSSIPWKKKIKSTNVAIIAIP